MAGNIVVRYYLKQFMPKIIQASKLITADSLAAEVDKWVKKNPNIYRRIWYEWQGEHYLMKELNADGRKELFRVTFDDLVAEMMVYANDRILSNFGREAPAIKRKVTIIIKATIKHKDWVNRNLNHLKHLAKNKI